MECAYFSRDPIPPCARRIELGFASREGNFPWNMFFLASYSHSELGG